MAMSKGIRMGSVVIGGSLLVLTLISLICGVVVISKMSSPAAVSIGLWGLYFAVPGVFSVLAGFKEQSSLLAVALGTNILGTILAIVGLSIGATFWAVLSSTCTGPLDGISNHYYVSIPNFKDGHCYCFYGNKYIDYPASCSDLDTIRGANGAVTIVFALFAILTFVGSIYGCAGTCCAPRETTGVVVTTAQPGTVVMTTQSYPAYNQQLPPYGQGQVVMDTKTHPYD